MCPLAERYVGLRRIKHNKKKIRQMKKKTDFPLDSLRSDFTSSPPSPLLDSSPTQEDSKEVLLANSEVVPFISQETSDEPQMKRHLSRVGKLILLSLLGLGGLVILPSFLSSLAGCSSKAKQAEAKNNLGALNRAQQAYFLDHQQFTTDLAQLGVGIKNPSTNYSYSIRATKKAVFNYAISRKGNHKSSVGGVFTIPATNLDPKADQKEILTVAIACEALRPGATQPAAPTLQKGIPTCGEGTRDLASR
jgi:type IV pilus assembly protein PilA